MKCSKIGMAALVFVLVWVIFTPLEEAKAADGAVKVKVHKDRIRILTGDQSGLVQVIGSVGAIESTAAVRAYLRREETGDKQPFDVATDGSFQTSITAPAGEKLRVYAQAGDKTSYGTFTVPSISSETQVPTSVSTAFMPEKNETPSAQVPIPQVIMTPEPPLADIEALGLDPVKLRRELVKAHQENIRLRRELQRVWLQLEQLQSSLQRLLQDFSSVTSAVASPSSDVPTQTTQIDGEDIVPSTSTN
ncbi:MAG: hypothetical protein JW709_05240 [Sedimentisphaerales bacterium]|nr:hypothetical protein [Sedimentisphaerales bacterium]